ncbi:MAG: AAA family ATPase [Bacteroidota bacterium]|nr:AAA family ATPase [Bacteroidota bacterium]
MIKDYLYNQILEEFKYPPTEGQEKVITSLADFVTSDDQDSIFLLKGYAGTGKTTLVGSLVKVLDKLNIRSVLLAPTGRAAKVFSRYANKPAYTIHKKIYRQLSGADISSRFVLDRNVYSKTFFIVDEASMIANESYEKSLFGTGRLLDDLIEYVYNGKHCKLILVGDTAQLPPVGLTVSPALSVNDLDAYGMDLYDLELTDVVRQSADSGILYNATELRQMIACDDFYPGYFPIEYEQFIDVKRISGAELIDTIQECYDLYGIEETIVVTRTNQRANRFNQGIRNSVLFRDAELSTGDLLMVVKNNYHWLTENDQADFIANGDIAEVVKIRKYEELYGFRYANVTLRFIDYTSLEIDCKIFLDTLQINGASFPFEEQQKLYNAVSEDYTDIKNKRNRWEKVRENDYFNALQVKFAYAVTCHKAQGGQWKAVFIDQGYLTEERIDIEFLRWLYTAFTRPTERLYLVNFNKEFFGEEDNSPSF